MQAVEPLKLELSNVRASLSLIQGELKQATIRNDELETYWIRSCLRISSVPETPNEDVSQVVFDIARRVGVDIQSRH